MTAEAFAALEEARRQNPGIGDIPLPPAPKDPSVCLSRSLARDWWNRAVTRAGLKPQAWPRLALAEAEVRLGPHGLAAQGAMRTRRPEKMGQGRLELPTSRLSGVSQMA